MYLQGTITRLAVLCRCISYLLDYIAVQRDVAGAWDLYGANASPHGTVTLEELLPHLFAFPNLMFISLVKKKP